MGSQAAIFLATGFGLGYLPKAPGTWGSLGGVALTWGLWKFSRYQFQAANAAVARALPDVKFVFFISQAIVAVVLAVVGYWAASRAVKHFGTSDPQNVVIDEISGQQIALLGGLGWSAAPNWKYFLLGFILFRVFDIWKPFPARRVESWPGGRGVMADDWVAGIYAALGLWLARTLGL